MCDSIMCVYDSVHLDRMASPFAGRFAASFTAPQRETRTREDGQVHDALPPWSRPAQGHDANERHGEQHHFLHVQPEVERLTERNETTATAGIVWPMSPAPIPARFSWSATAGARRLERRETLGSSTSAAMTIPTTALAHRASNAHLQRRRQGLARPTTATRVTSSRSALISAVRPVAVARARPRAVVDREK